MSASIRIANQDDIGALSDFIVNYRREESGHVLDQVSTRQRLDVLFARFETGEHAVYLAEQDEILIGYAVVHWAPFLLKLGTEGYISELFVGAQNRGQGVGTGLLRKIEENAVSKKCWRLMLNNLKTSMSYQSDFYKKQGFSERVDMGNFVKQL